MKLNSVLSLLEVNERDVKSSLSIFVNDDEAVKSVSVVPILAVVPVNLTVSFSVFAPPSKVLTVVKSKVN